MKGFKPIVKMASGGLVPKMPKAPGKAGASMTNKMPKPPSGMPKPKRAVAVPSIGGNSKPGLKAFAKGGHADLAEDKALVKSMVKPSALKSDKKFGK